MNQHDTNTFKNSTNLTKWTKWFLYLNIIIAVVSIASTCFEYKFLSDIKTGVYTSSELILTDSAFNEDLQSLVNIVQFLILVVSGVLILRWIYISNYNAHQLSTSKMRFTPWWSIGWYFIPIFNLWKPYQVMKEILKVSANPINWEKQSVSSMLIWWWFFWIVNGFFLKLSFQFEIRANGINELMKVDLAYIVSDFIFILLSFSLLAIIDEIYKMQTSNYNTNDDFIGGDYKNKEFNEQDVSIAIQFSIMNNNRWELLHANLDKTKQFLNSSGWIEKDNYLFVWTEANDDNLYQYMQLDYDSNGLPVLRAGFMSYSETLYDSPKPLDSLMVNFDDEIAFNNIVQSITKSLEKISTSHDVLLEFVLFELGGLVLGGEVGKNFVENSGFGTSDYVGFSTKSDEAEVLFDTFMLERSVTAEFTSELFIKLSIEVLDNIMQKYSLGKYEKNLMKIDCGIVKKYSTDRGFGFISHTFVKIHFKEVFFHIKKIKKEHPELAKKLEDKDFSKTIYFWYEIENSEKGEFVARVLKPENIHQTHAAYLPTYIEEIERIWRDIDIELHDCFEQITIDLVGNSRTQELYRERDKLELQKKEEEDELTAEKIEKENIEHYEFEQLMSEMIPLKFTLSSQVSAYIMNNRLGYKYKNISGIVKMEQDGNIWNFDGGFPPRIYAKVCSRLGLNNKGSHARVVDFKSFNDLM